MLNFAYKTPDGLGLHKVVLNGVLPEGGTIENLNLWPVDPTVPAGYHQDFTQGPDTARGWQIVDGTVKPILAADVPAGPSPDWMIWAQQLELGYLDPVTSLKLKTTESAQAKFTSQVTLLQLAFAAGAITGSTPVEFWDYTDEARTLTLNEFFGLMLRYGMHCQQIFKDYAP